MSADPTLTAALAQDGAWLFGALEVQLPAKNLRLIDGSGVMTIFGNTFVGEDADFGVLAAIDEIEENDGDEAPEIRFRLFPKDATALTILANPAMQGSLVQVLAGAVDPATMMPIGTPEVVFLGEVDVPTMHLSQGARDVEFSVVSIFERLFEIDEGQRATDGFHQSIWPGELGLDGVTGTTEKLYWGAKPPASSSATDSGSWRNENRYARF